MPSTATLHGETGGLTLQEPHWITDMANREMSWCRHWGWHGKADCDQNQKLQQEVGCLFARVMTHRSSDTPMEFQHWCLSNTKTCMSWSSHLGKQSLPLK